MPIEPKQNESTQARPRHIRNIHQQRPSKPSIYTNKALGKKRLTPTDTRQTKALQEQGSQKFYTNKALTPRPTVREGTHAEGTCTNRTLNTRFIHRGPTHRRNPAK